MPDHAFPKDVFFFRPSLVAVAILLLVSIAGCSDDNDESSESGDPPQIYSLSGDVSVGMGQFDEGELVLRNEENGDEVTIDWSGDSYTFEFPQLLKDGESYRIVVVSEPSQWDCGPQSNTQGTINGEDVNDIEIECYGLP